MQPLVSIIVPIYQTEKYLPRCLDSLQQQNLTNIEIILIDDGSPDRCGIICDEYASKDERFKVFHQKHAGTSVARNLGIRMATSEYLMFADSDDFVHEDFCKDAYECAVKNNADVVKFGLQRVKNHKLFGIQYKEILILPEGYITREELINHLVEKGSPSCDKLFHKALFDTFKYPEGYAYEDVMLYKVIYNAKCIYSLNKVLYYHCYRAGSTMTLKSSKVCRNWFEMFFQRLQDLSSLKVLPPERINFELKKMALNYCIIKKRDLSDPYYLFSLQTLLKTKNTPKEFTWRRKILFVLLKHYPSLFEFICNVYGKRES